MPDALSPPPLSVIFNLRRHTHAPPHPLPLPKRLHHHQAFMVTSTARAPPSYRAPSPPRGIKGEAEPLPPCTSLLLSSSRTAQPPPEAQNTIGALSASRGGPSHPLSPPLQLQMWHPPSLLVAGKHTPAIPSPPSLSFLPHLHPPPTGRPSICNGQEFSLLPWHL
jgi:hypothetical protein